MSLDYKKEFYKYALKEHKLNDKQLSNFFYQQNIDCFNNSSTPYITEERKVNLSQMDIFSRLMMDRIIFIGESISSYVANIVQAQLLFLQSLDRKSDICIYINSPGGSIYAGLGIYDTMQYVEPNISTICTGFSASISAVLLCAGNKGKRFSLKHSRIMLHQPNGYYTGQASDILISAKQIMKLKEEIYHIISQHSNQDIKTIKRYLNRDYWITSEEAIKFGIIDKILIKNNRINFEK
ncbi:MAG: ATP-dependent Clp protease proteolytic subunit [Bacteroides sp.]|nr:MAG: ATP-dependent Clp protease proteolytic subunit [Bacteroides sp.]